jgi:hypothetical protein
MNQRVSVGMVSPACAAHQQQLIVVCRASRVNDLPPHFHVCLSIERSRARC